MGNQIQIKTLTNFTIFFKQCVKPSFRLDVDGVFIIGTFYVTSQDFGRDYQLLLGYDYLMTNKIILNFEDKTVTVKNKNIKLNFAKIRSQGHMNNFTSLLTNDENQEQTFQPNSEENSKNSKKNRISHKKIVLANTLQNIFF